MANSFAGLVKDLKRSQTEGLLITERASDYLKDHSDIVWTEELLEQMYQLLIGNTDNDDRTGRFGASSRGTCERRQLWSYLGMPVHHAGINPQLNNIFFDGKWRHLRWQMMGLDAGFLTHVEVPFRNKTTRMKVSLDGINEDEDFIFELKGVRHIKPYVPDDHLLQIHTCMLLSGYDLCSYVQEHKLDQSWYEIVVRKDPAIMARVEAEIGRLNGHVEQRTLPPVLTECQTKSGSYNGCPYRGRECCVAQTSFPVRTGWGDA
jgi:hypothetical protein